MYYTIRQMAERFGVTEHTLRFYTDKGLLPCTRDGGNRRVCVLHAGGLAQHTPKYTAREDTERRGADDPHP